MKKEAFGRGGLPPAFMERFGQHVTGFISGFDRLRFRATLRPLFQPGGMEIYLYSCKVLVKDFGHFAKELTARIRQAAYQHSLATQGAHPLCEGLELEQRGFGPGAGPAGRHLQRSDVFIGLRGALSELPTARGSSG
jgi:hypothetical protein